MKKLFILGTSGHAKVILDIAKAMTIYNEISFLDPSKEKGTVINGCIVEGSENNLDSIVSGDYSNIQIAIGIGDNSIRNKVYENLNKINPKLKYAVLIHPSAVVSGSAVIDDGTVIMPCAVVNANSKIGRFSIINTKASVDHDCLIGDFVTIAPGSTLGGNVEIGDFSSVCLGASVIHGIKIGTETVVGANSLVLKNLEENSVYYGSPCKFIRKREHGESYL